MTTLDTDRAPFIAAICAEPDEDTHRLVYADFLQEHGEEQRAEFIRVQCEVARIEHGLKPRGSNPEWLRLQELKNRERHLLNFAWQNWLGACREIIPQGMRIPDYVEFRRGFVERVTCPAADWLAHADRLVWHPTQTLGDELSARCVNVNRVSRDHVLWDCGRYCLACGLGKKPRPCPPTAQPIRRVKLTSCDSWDDFLVNHEFSILNTSGVVGEGVWWSSKWPGVTFELPP